MAVRKVIMASGLLLCLNIPLVAFQAQTVNPPQSQTGDRGGQRRFGRDGLKHKRLGGFRELNLTEEQRQQTRAILQRHLESIRGQREELSRLREKRMTGSLTPEDQERAKALHQQLRDAREDMNSELKNVLTAEQRAQLEQREAERKARCEERFRHRQEPR